MRKTQKSNGGAIGGDYSCAISEKWWYTATCEFITIPGGTTFTKWKIMKTAEIQLFQRFFIYVLSAKICNLGFSRFFVGIIFYLREVLLTLHYEKRLFEHASQPRVAGSDIRLLSHLWSRTNLSRDSYRPGWNVSIR